MTMVLEMLMIILIALSWTIKAATPNFTTANASGAATATNAISEAIAALKKKIRNLFFFGPGPGPGPGHGGPPMGHGGQGGYYAGGFGYGPYGGPGYWGPGSGGWYQYNPYYGANGYGPSGGMGNMPKVPGYARQSIWSRIIEWSCFFHNVGSRFVAGLLFIAEILGIIAVIAGLFFFVFVVL